MAPFYCVVEFLNEQSVAVISSKWLRNNDTECYWPTGPANISNLARKHAMPGTQWSVHPCKVKKSYDNLERARQGADKLQYQSNLDTSAAENSQEPLKSSRKKTRAKHHKSHHGPALKLVGSPKGSSSDSSVSAYCAQLSSPRALKVPRGTLFSSEKSKSVTPGGELEFVSSQRSIILENQTGNSQSHFLTASNAGNSCTKDELSLADEDTLLDIRRTIQSLNDRQSRFEEEVIRYLVKISADQREILQLVARVETNKAFTPPCSNQPSFELPVTNLTQYQELNEWLLSSNNLKSLAQDIAIVGGEKPQDIIFRILSSLLTNKLGSEVSLTGKGSKSKAGLKGTKILELIYETVRNTKNGKGIENFQIDKCIQNWLKGASDRDGGRVTRRAAVCHPININGEDHHNETSEDND